MTSYRTTMRQALEEMYQNLNEDNLDLMRKAAGGAKQTLKMKDGKIGVDSFTASAIMQIYDKINDKNKKTFENMMKNGKKADIMKLQKFAMSKVNASYEEFEEEFDLEEGKVVFDDHDADDPDFVKLIKKHGLKAKSDGDDTTVTGSPDKIEKVLQTIYGNDWKDMYTRKGQNFENFAGKEFDLDEGTKQVLAHGGKGKYKVTKDGDKIEIKFGGKVVGTADFDRGADSFFVSIKGEKGQKSFDDAQAIADYFAKNKITEEVELDEALNPKDKKVVDAFYDGRSMDGKMLSTDGKKLEKTGMGGQTIASKSGSKFKIVAKMDSSSTQDVVKYIEKSFPKNVIEEVDLDEAKYDLYHKDFSSAMKHAYKMAKKLHGITVDSKEIDDKVASGPKKPSEGKTNSYRLEGDKGSIQVQVYNKGGPKPFELNFYKEEVELDEAIKVFRVSSSKLQGNIHAKDEEQAAEFAKKMGFRGKLTITDKGKYMGQPTLEMAEEVEEGAAADARRAMRNDPDMKQRAFSKDVSSTDDDEKAASKNIMMQLRKAVSLRSYDVEFADGKKQKVNQRIAQAVQNKYNKMRRPADKEKFQAQIAKSYKDMLKTIKSGYGEQKESILEKIDRKIKENKNG